VGACAFFYQQNTYIILNHIIYYHFFLFYAPQISSKTKKETPQHANIKKRLQKKLHEKASKKKRSILSAFAVFFSCTKWVQAKNNFIFS